MTINSLDKRIAEWKATRHEFVCDDMTADAPVSFIDDLIAENERLETNIKSLDKVIDKKPGIYRHTAWLAEKNDDIIQQCQEMMSEHQTRMDENTRLKAENERMKKDNIALEFNPNGPYNCLVGSVVAMNKEENLASVCLGVT